MCGGWRIHARAYAREHENVAEGTRVVGVPPHDLCRGEETRISGTAQYGDPRVCVRGRPFVYYHPRSVTCQGK